MGSILKSRWTWFMTIISLILLCNTLLYQIDTMKPLPQSIALYSLIDFLIVIPVVTYFFIIRKRYSLKYLLPVALAGYGAAWLIVPQGYLASYSFVKYIVFAGEAAFIGLELFILFQVAVKLPRLIRAYKMHSEDGVPFFLPKVEEAFRSALKSTKVIKVLMTDMGVIYYSLFSWRKRPPRGENTFTYHQQTSVIALNIMLIHALAIESIGVHIWLHSWNAVASTILLILNIYTLLLLLAELQANRLCPFVITDEKLYLHVGLMKRLTVNVEDIREVRCYNGPEKISKAERKHIFDGRAADFVQEKPAIEMTFVRRVEVKKPFGMTQKVEKAHVRPDDTKGFYEALSAKVSS